MHVELQGASACGGFLSQCAVLNFVLRALFWHILPTQAPPSSPLFQTTSCPPQATLLFKRKARCCHGCLNATPLVLFSGWGRGLRSLSHFRGGTGRLMRAFLDHSAYMVGQGRKLCAFRSVCSADLPRQASKATQSRWAHTWSTSSPLAQWTSLTLDKVPLDFDIALNVRDVSRTGAAGGAWVSQS